MQICPVGALTGAAYRFRARPFDLVSTPSVCEHCASGCALRIDHRRGTVLRRMARNDPAVNEEWNCDKGRWAFTYPTLADRLTEPLVRDDEGNLQVASWPEALDAAARGLTAARDAKGVGVLVGGRVSVEDAYAYGKFARVALQHQRHRLPRPPALGRGGAVPRQPRRGHRARGRRGDLRRPRARPHGPARRVRARGGVADRLPAAAQGVPQEQDDRVRRGAVRHPRPGQGRRHADPAAPGTEAEVLAALADGTHDGSHPGVAAAAEALAGERALVLVGERLAGVPGALSAAAALAASTGARLAWIPRRAGERGAVEAGALPGLLPGGRPVTEAAARVDVGAAWGVIGLPEQVGRDTAAIIAAAAEGQLAGLVVGGVDPADLPEHAERWTP